MERQKVVSREYKVMLRPRHFHGPEKTLLGRAHALWRDVARKVGPFGLGTAGDLSRIKARRFISFLDTRKHRLNRAHYIFRDRRAEDGSDRALTLKFRHADRFLAQARDMSPKGSVSAKTKFEEDIKAPSSRCTAFRRRLRGTLSRRSPTCAT